MKLLKVLCSSFFAVTLIVAITSCGVPDPELPTASVLPVDGSSIKNSDSIVITFSASMSQVSLVLSGDMAAESNGGVWSATAQNNDTLTISPGTGVWTLGPHTLVVDVVSTNGAPLTTLTMNYTVEAPIPTAVVVPADSSTIIGSDLIVIIFSTTMEPSTLVVSGDMAAESKAGVWATTNVTNDTLLIRPVTVWSSATDTLVIDVDSTQGASLPTLTLNYFVDVAVPVVKTVLPPDGAAINNTTAIAVTFTLEMNPATLQPLAGSMGVQSNNVAWSSNSNPNDTLTIIPLAAWSGGLHDLVIDVDASNGIPLPTLTLNYTIDDVLPTASVSPVTGSSIMSDKEIEIVFSESMDISSLMPSGTLWDNADQNVSWSMTTNNNDTLTISPATTWPVQTIELALDILDLAGNSLSLSLHEYIVDVMVPVIFLTGSANVDIERGTAYVDAGATASDNIDGDISSSIVVAGDTVDVNTVGTYIITYDVTDAAGLPATQVTRTVNVTADVTIPVITLSGNAVVNIERGSTYVDDGATASDSFDGDLTGSIITVNPVDTSTVGTYTVTYNVDDSSGNAATEVTRTVNVTPDITVPVITLVGNAIESVEQGTAYVDAGATASDNFDGDISGSIVVGGDTVNENIVGAYIITYDVTDSSGNPAVQVSRTVNVTADATIPTITLLGNAVVSIERGTTYIDAGATAADNIDGDITASIVIGGDTVDENTVAAYVITYNVVDSSGNAAVEVTRTVNVTADATIPVITLVGNTVENVEYGTTYTDAGATALDNFDGDISGSINVGGDTVDVNTVGTYIITYDVSDSTGNPAVQVTRTVNVIDLTKPVITLLGNNPQVVVVTNSYNEAGATALDDVDGDISGSIIIGGDIVDVNTVGSYTVTYNVSDAAGNDADEVTRTVNVTP